MKQYEVAMGIHTNDLREVIIRPTLESLGEWSQSAENLLLGTAAQESQLGFRLHSESDDGLGLYRISARTHTQIWDKFLINDPDLASKLRGLASQQQFLKKPHHELIVNLSYSTGVAWMVYKRHGFILPNNPSAYELAHSWLSYYCTRDDQNDQLTHKNIAEIDTFVQNYHALVLSENKILAA
jgi:hypothetical protein